MPNKPIILYLDGTDVPIEHFSEAISGWVEQLYALRDELAPNANVEWVIKELAVGSARCAILPEMEDGTSEDDIEQIISGYKDEWESYKNGLPSRHSYEVQASTRKITSILNGRIPAIKTGLEGEEITISSDEQRSAFKISKGYTSFGAVTGKIQTISMRSSHHFLLYDIEDDRKITCYLRQGSEDIMREMWGKTAIVEGDLYRDSKTGRVITVRDITVVQVFQALGNWRDAIGIAPPMAGSMSAEEAIRRTRG